MMYYNIIKYIKQENERMFNFNVERYEKVVNDAIALRPQIEKSSRRNLPAGI